MERLDTDGIIFDMDGTIWDNTVVFAPSWERAAKDHGYDVTFTPEKLMGLFGKTMTDIADACIPDDDAEKRYTTLKDCEIYEMQDLENSDIDTTYPGLATVIKKLSQKVPLYIVSNCQSGYIETFLHRSGLQDYFTDFICYGDNGKGKAANIAFMVKKHNMLSPVYIGDIQGDQIACEIANVPFIWATYGYGKVVKNYQQKIDDISDLPNVINIL